MPRAVGAVAQLGAITWIPLCAAGFYFCTTTPVAFQDAAGLVSGQVEAARRWASQLIQPSSEGATLGNIQPTAGPLAAADGDEDDAPKVNRGRKGDLLASRIRLRRHAACSRNST